MSRTLAWRATASTCAHGMRQAGQYQGKVGEVGVSQRRFAAGHWLVGRADQADFLVQRRGDVQGWRIGRVVEHADIGAAHQQPIVDMGARAFQNIERCAWKALLEFRDQVGREDFAGRRRDAKNHLAHGRAVELAQVLACAFGLFEDAFGVFEQGLARLGEGDTAAVAMEQGLAQLDFQLADLFAQGRLRDAELDRRAGKAAVFRDADEVLELFEIHGEIIGEWNALVDT